MGAILVPCRNGWWSWLPHLPEIFGWYRARVSWVLHDSGTVECYPLWCNHDYKSVIWCCLVKRALCAGAWCTCVLTKRMRLDISHARLWTRVLWLPLSFISETTKSVGCDLPLVGFLLSAYRQRWGLTIEWWILLGRIAVLWLMTL